MTIFASALALTLNNSAGNKTWRIEFPRQLSETFVLDVLTTLNSLTKRFDETPEAVGFFEGVSIKEGSSELVSSEFELVNFRCDSSDERRFLLLRGNSKVESLINASIPIISTSFPRNLGPNLSFAEMGQGIVQLYETRVKESSSSMEMSVIFAHCLELSAAIMERAAISLGNAWNIEWALFVDRALDRFFSQIIEEGVEASLSSVYHCFGLPYLDISQNVDALAKDLYLAYSKWWSNVDEITKSSDFIARRIDVAESTSRVLGRLDTSIYRNFFASGGDSVLTLLDTIGEASNRQLDAAIPLQDFISPRSSSSSKSIKSIRSNEHEPMSALGVDSNSSPFLVAVHNQESQYFTSPMDVVIGYVGGVLPEEPLSASQLNFDSSLDGCDWVEDEISVTAEGIVVRGYFTLDNNIANRLDTEMVVEATISYELSATSHLVDTVSYQGSAPLILARSWGGEYLATFDAGKKRLKLKAIDFSETDSYQSVDSDIKSVGVVAFAANPLLEGVPMSPLADQRFHGEKVSISEIAQVESDGKTISLFRESTDKSIQSPLVAAMFKEKLAASEPSKENQNALWGRLEELISQKIEDEDFVGTHFNVALGEDIPLRGAEGLQCDNPSGFIAQRQVGTFLDNAGICPSTDFLDSQQYEEFTEAFLGLGIADTIKDQVHGASDWVSKTPWRHLFVEKSRIEAYLDAYRNLMDFAKVNYGPNEIFVATYPFSFSTWDLVRGECTAVLLSPLHPIRLAWLSSVESGLWDSKDSSKLSGIVEGWNMPLVGPGHQYGSSLLAVPTDYGRDSLFLGWSMMVPIQSQPQKVSVPAKVAASVAPGSSSTGLNSSAVSSALQDFKGVNPHYPSLIIDLGASSGSETARLDEVDQAVLDTIEKWANKSDGPPGGVHVLDSASRSGTPPISQIQAFARKATSPFSWRRYEQKAAQSPRCQIRLLQDPGVSVQIVQEHSRTFGSIPQIPYRRFFSSQQFSNAPKGTSSISTSLSSDHGWAPFVDAIRKAESFSYGNHVNSSLGQSSLADGTAEWTVSGEGLLNPSSVATFLSASSRQQQMLWEWHPPYFDVRTGEGRINQRAYMTIARIPSAFKSQLSASLSSLKIEDSEVNRLSEDILRVLGSRGMGLSSLLYMGSTLVKGALGFYSAFKLIDGLPMNGDFLTVPIDACDFFLRTLADDERGIDGFSRADLLGISIEDDQVNLMSIEIKMYDLDNVDGSVLPDPTSTKLDEARNQVAASARILESISEKYQELDSEAHHHSLLWRTNLAALLETALKLSPNKHELDTNVSRAISKVLSGKVSLGTSRPIVMYFSGAKPSSSGSEIVFDNVKPKDGEIDSLNIVAQAGTVLRGDLPPTLLKKIVGQLTKDKKNGLTQNYDVSTNANPELKPKSEEELPTSENKEPPEVEKDEGNEKPDVVISEPSGFYKIKVGSDRDGKEWFFEPNLKGNLPHFGVIGNSGSGKTQIMKTILSSFSKKGQHSGKPGVLIIDYKGDISEGNDNFAQQNGFEVFSAKGLELDFWKITDFQITELGDRQAAINARANAFASFIKKLFPNMGAAQRSHLKRAIETSYKRAEDQGYNTPLMKDILRIYEDLLPKIDAVHSYMEMMEDIQLFPQTSETSRPLTDFFAKDKRIVINFRPMTVYGDEFLRKMSVSVVLEALVQNMYAHYSPHGEYFEDGEEQLQVLNQLVFVDEAHNLLQFDLNSLMKIIREGRSFGHGLLLATQGMDEFQATETDYRSLIPNWCIFQMNNPSKADLESIGVDQGDAGELRARINQFNVGEALFITPTKGPKGEKVKAQAILKTSSYFNEIEKSS